LPRIRIEHRVPQAEQVCDCGCQRVEIGEVTSEQLDIVPAKIQVIRHIRKQYACDCGQCIRSYPFKTAATPAYCADTGGDATTASVNECPHSLKAKILYGGGLRLLECIRLRIQDIAFDYNKIFIRSRK